MADGEYTPGFEEEEEAPFGSALPPRAGMKRNRAAFEFAPDVSDIAKSVMRPHVWSHMLAGRTFPYAPPWNPAHISYRRVFELCDQNAAFHEVLSQNPDAVNAQLAEVVRRIVERTRSSAAEAAKRVISGQSASSTRMRAFPVFCFAYSGKTQPLMAHIDGRRPHVAMSIRRYMMRYLMSMAPRADLKPRDNEVLLNILRCSFRGGGANLSHELPRYSDVVNGRVVWDAASINDRIPIAFEAWVTCCTLFSVTAGFDVKVQAHDHRSFSTNVLGLFSERESGLDQSVHNVWLEDSAWSGNTLQYSHARSIVQEVLSKMNDIPETQ